MASFLAREKNAALRAAVSIKAGRLLEVAEMDVALGIRALEMPIEDLQTRASQFGEVLREVERQRRAAQDLLAGDRRRALEKLEGRAATLRQEARSALLAIMENSSAGRGSPQAIEDATKAAVAAAIPEFFGPRLEEVSRVFSGEVEETLAQHVGAAEQLVGSVRQRAAALFEIPEIPVAGSDVFAMAREPFWVTHKWDQTIGSLAAGALERLLPANIRVSRVKSRLATEIDELIQRNIENLRWATLQNLENAFRRFSGWFDERLAEAIAATQGAIAAALSRRRSHEDQAEGELLRLRAATKQLSEVRCELAESPSPEPVAASAP